jgi:hypothetical protein
MPVDVPLLPVWLVIPFTVVAVVLTVELGYRIGRRTRLSPTHEAEHLAAELATPAVGLLGLMLAFTFGWAATRFDSRLNARLSEAKQVANMFRLSDFLPASDRERLRSILRDYISVSLGASRGVAGFQAAFAKREAMHREIWQIAVRAGEANPNSEVTAQFVSEVNEMLNSHLNRSILAVSSRIPSGIVYGLFAILILTMGMLGYQMGLTSPSRSPALVPLILSISLVVFLIVDLNRPLEGLLGVHDRALAELQRELEPWK